MQKLSYRFWRHVGKIIAIFASSLRAPGRFMGNHNTCRWMKSIPVHPVDVNGINKIAGEQYHIALPRSTWNCDQSVLRLTNTYGPRMRIKDARQTFLGIWIRNLLEGKPIQVFGDGQATQRLQLCGRCSGCLDHCRY